jgi:ketosteroid isomerase-like protein
LIVAALIVAPPALAQDKATMQKLNDDFAAVFARGDYAAVAAHYAEDAVLLPSGAEMVKGRSGIQAFWAKAGQGIESVRLTTLEVQPLGSDAAQEIGSFALKTKGQPPQEVVGKYVVVWRKVGTDWKLATDIWNENR